MKRRKERRVVRWVIVSANGGMGFVAYTRKPKRPVKGMIVVRLDGYFVAPFAAQPEGKP